MFDGLVYFQSYKKNLSLSIIVTNLKIFWQVKHLVWNCILIMQNQKSSIVVHKNEELRSDMLVLCVDLFLVCALVHAVLHL